MYLLKLLSLAFLILVLILVSTNNGAYTLSFANIMWVIILFVGIYGFILAINPKVTLRRLSMLKNFFSPARARIILILFSIGVVLLSGLNKYYYLGGDDTRLFYIYPELYLNNFIDNAYPTSLSGYLSFLPPNSIMFFLYFLVILQKITFGLNLQSILYTLNLVLGLFFFYKFVRYILPSSKDIYRKIMIIISSFLYVFSIYNTYIPYNSKLIVIFIVSVFPLSLYLFVKAVRERKIYLIALLSLILTVTTFASTSSLWFAASLLVCIPVLIYALRGNLLRSAKYIIVLVAFLIATNINWLVFVPYSTLVRHDEEIGSNSIVSDTFIDENIQSARLTAEKNSVHYPLMGLFHYKIQKDFNWPYLPIYESWYLKLLPVNTAFFVIILVSGFLLQKRKKLTQTYLFFSLSFLLAIYFFTVNFGSTRLGNIGIEFFVLLIDKIPGFLVFRNMYDKFSHAVAFSYSSFLLVGCLIILDKIKNIRFKSYFILLYGALVLLNIKPVILNEFNNLPIWTTKNQYASVSNLDDDYLDLAEYIKNTEDDGRYLSLPLSDGNVVVIRDENIQNHYYSGVSPLLIMSGKNDYSGVLSFGPYASELRAILRAGDYERAGELFQKMNVKYIAVNNSIPEELKNSYLYRENYLDPNNEQIRNVLFGELIRNFGNNYSLYKINENYDSEKIYLADNLDKFPNEFSNISYSKINEAKFEVDVERMTSSDYIVFLEPYYDEWILQWPDGKEIQQAEHLTAHEYANSWQVSTKNMPEEYTEVNEDGTIRASFSIYFKPYDLYYPFYIMSFVSLIILAIYTGYGYIRTKQK